ncbi:MAG: choice-of-anchor J domain-containing protein [Planctomycetota bacterium]|jgi:hypothetical protein
MRISRFVPAFLLMACMAGPAVAQTVLLDEDFDAGLPGTWSRIQLGYVGDNWLTGFNLVDGTGDMNHEWFCDFGGLFRDNILMSPSMDLTNLTDITFRCDQFQQFAGTMSYNAIEVSTDGGGSFVPVHVLGATPNGFSKLQVSLDAFAGMPDVRVAFHYQGVIANDWSIDNVRVTSPWANLDGCVGGVGGPPLLTGDGPATAGSSLGLHLSNAPGSNSSTLVVGVSALNAPFKGGVMVPSLTLLLPFITTPGGTLDLAGPFPPGIPAGFSLYFQFWMAHATGPLGFLGSNALSVTAQ